MAAACTAHFLTCFTWRSHGAADKPTSFSRRSYPVLCEQRFWEAFAQWRQRCQDFWEDAPYGLRTITPAAQQASILLFQSPTAKGSNDSMRDFVKTCQVYRGSARIAGDAIEAAAGSGEEDAAAPAAAAAAATPAAAAATPAATTVAAAATAATGAAAAATAAGTPAPPQ